MERALRRQVEAAIAKLSQAVDPSIGAAEAVAALSRTEFVEQIIDAAKPFIQRAVEAGGSAAASSLPSGVGFDVTNPEVQRFVDNYAARLARGINEHTVVRVRDMLGEGMEKGETVQELTQRVRDWAGEAGDAERGLGYRAENVARTESARAQIAGQEQAWKQSDVVVGKKWLLAPDACPFCEAAAALFNTKTTPLGVPFAMQGTVITANDGGTMKLDYSDVDGPPLHPQCRCDVIPVMQGEV